METSTVYLRTYKHSPTEDRLVPWVTEERIINLKSILYETVVFCCSLLINLVPHGML